LDSPVEKPATQSEDKLLNIFSSIFISLIGTIEGKDSFKHLDKPQLRDALYSNISLNPSKVVCLFSNINKTICLKIIKSLYLFVINVYFSK
jgi:hypothetical protein